MPATFVEPINLDPVSIYRNVDRALRSLENISLHSLATEEEKEHFCQTVIAIAEIKWACEKAINNEPDIEI